jgi:hypothetical protein
MVYNGLFPPSDILESRKHDVSETASVSILRWGGKTPTQSGPLERAKLNHWTILVRFTGYLITWDKANSEGENK